MANAVVTKRVVANAANPVHVQLVVLQRLSNPHVAAKKLPRNPRAAPMVNAVVTKHAAANAVKQALVQLGAALR